MRGVAVAAALALAMACAPAPSRRPPELGVVVPAEWTSETAREAGIVPHDWWTTFDQPELNAIILEALEYNHDLRAAAARVDAAAALARIAGADLLPSANLDVSGSRRKQNFIGLPIPGAAGGVLSSTSTTYGVSLDTSWEADLWGRLRAGKAAALADLKGAESRYAGARLSIAGQTAKTWFAVAEARRQVALAEETVGSFRDTAERVRMRYERGLRSPLDLRLALSNVASAEAELERRRDTLQRTRRQLEVLLGRYPEAALSGTDLLPPPPEEVPSDLPGTLVSRRPDLVAAEYRLKASDARLAEARRSLYPRLRLTASGGTSSDELKDLLDGDFSVWSLAAGVVQPLFQGGRLRAGVKLADANAQDALASYVQEVLRAYAEVETLLSSESLLARREEALRIATEQAVAATRLAEDRYDSGLEDLVTVLDSQRRALTSESLLLGVRRQRLDARVDLYLALGGGFDRDGDVGTPAAIPPANKNEEARPS